MFYKEGNYCYCKPDKWDGDFVVVANVEYPVYYSTGPDDVCYIETKDGQSHILV